MTWLKEHVCEKPEIPDDADSVRDYWMCDECGAEWTPFVSTSLVSEEYWHTTAIMGRKVKKERWVEKTHKTWYPRGVHPDLLD